MPAIQLYNWKRSDPGPGAKAGASPECDSEREECGLIVAWPERRAGAGRGSGSGPRWCAGGEGGGGGGDHELQEVSPSPHSRRRRSRRHSRPPSINPKCVTFHPKVDAVFVDTIDAMSKAEIKSIWYSDKEYKKIKKEVKATLKFDVMMQKRGDGATVEQRHLAGSLICMRGLEHLTSAAVLEERRVLKDAAIEAVLEVQERLLYRTGNDLLHSEEDDDIADDEIIAEASMDATRSSRDLAASMGSLDAATALTERMEGGQALRQSMSRSLSHPFSSSSGSAEMLMEAMEMADVRGGRKDRRHSHGAVLQGHSDCSGKANDPLTRRRQSYGQEMRGLEMNEVASHCESLPQIIGKLGIRR